MKRFSVSAILIAFLVLAGCANERAQLQIIYTAVPLTQTQIAMMATPSATPIPAAVAFAVAVEQARATSAAIEATMAWMNGQMTATAWARDAQATAQAAQMTQVAFAVGATATHEAMMLRATQQAAATATAYPPTATAQAVQAMHTQMAWALQATNEANRLAVQATADAANAEIVRLALERERATNAVRAWGPWAILWVAFFVIAWFLLRWSSTRIVPRDAFGAAPVILRGNAIIDPERSHGPVIIYDEEARIVPGDPDVVARAQQVQLIRALPAGRPPVETSNLLPVTRGGQPPIEVVDAEIVRGWLEDVESQIEEDGDE